MPRLIPVIVLVALARVLASSGPVGDGDHPAARRFLERRDEQVTSYRALRRLEAHNVRFKTDGWLDAWTTLDPESGFRFEIVAQRGSRTILERVLRKALEREAEAYRHQETDAAAITPANYHFGAERSLADGLVAIEIAPKRPDALLLRGALIVAPESGDLVQIEGQPVKRPSFWTRKVQFVRRYGRVGGVRVPLIVESVADVFLAGRSTFSMRYEYASLNGRNVDDADSGAAGRSASATEGVPADDPP